ncbi:hypothetical protein H8F21_18295 [Pseudomonas sp. P66]|uniref:Uncharacterized protein n=2 Tax=Pseudomonas TaxID=286 RepID=A0AB35WSX9_9PSED|nr:MULTISPECIES: hypothetical protein [Pseudomonas]MBM3107426.1 hypothetical protein [Pseudomonas arcuscaelestis]MBM3112470.1 hypothetical protein [Pseudomonas arcuscaelestis]MBM5459520.1 hypothetical protein [Pseudomonas arcuscaelestis]MEE1867557.1 hypothetical protein [Pseudomonas sp. 120P]MEE1958384.1 hypothetical protein [Pseudomonas sp. 119P]
MNRSQHSYQFCQPVILTRCCDWPSDTVLKRRRSVLFAFTFSPHLHAL